MKKLTPAFFLIILLFAYCSFTVNAAPITDIPVVLEQPNGNTVHCFMSGDEFFNYYHDKDGAIIIQGEDGYYTYAQLDEKSWPVPSHNRVGLNGTERYIPTKITTQDVIIPDERYDMFGVDPPKMTRAQGPPIDVANLIIFVRFQGDEEFSADEIQRVSDSYDVNVKPYIEEISYGQSTIMNKVAQKSSSVFCYVDPNPRSYYCKYNALTNPDGYTASQETSRRTTLTKNAALAAEEYVTADLDLNSDGTVDNIIFIVKGKPEGWNEILWPHRSRISGVLFSSGLRAGNYNLILSDNISNSTNAHELLHSFGMPDLYRSTSNGYPIYRYDVMANNVSSIQHTTIQMKARYGNWVSDQFPTINQSGNYSLNPITEPTDNIFKLETPDMPNQYFLLEYRDKTSSAGGHEEGLPLSGLLVYRVDSSRSGNFNGPPDEIYAVRYGDQTSIPHTFGKDRIIGRGSQDIPLQYYDSSHITSKSIDDVQIKVNNIVSASEGASQLDFEVNYAHELTVISENDSFGEVSFFVSDETYEKDGKALSTAEVILHAVPKIGYRFQEWKITSVNEAGMVLENKHSVTFDMPDEDLNIEAVYIADADYQYIVNLSVSDPTGGVIAISPQGALKQGDLVEVEVTINPGYDLIGWESVGYTIPDGEKESLKLQFIMPDHNVKLKALISKIHTVNFKSSNPSVGSSINIIPGRQVAAGRTVEFEYELSNSLAEWLPFSHLKADNYVIPESNKEDNPFTFVMPDSDVTFTAVLSPRLYIPRSNMYLSVKVNGDQMVSNTTGSFSDYLSEGDLVEIEAVPFPNMQFVKWVAPNYTGANRLTYLDLNKQKIEFTMTSGYVYLNVNIVSTYTTTSNANPAHGGSVNVSPPGAQTAGTAITAVATPNGGYQFDRWEATGYTIPAGQETNATLNFNLPANNVTLEAVFSAVAPSTYTVTANADPVTGGSVNVSPPGAQTFGTAITAVATPNGGYQFERWEATGYTIPAGDETNATLNFNLPANNVSLEAVFVATPQNPKVINVNIAGRKNIPVDGFIVIHFSVPMHPDSSGRVQLDGQNLMPGTWSNGNQIYTVLYDNLKYSTIYTIDISGFESEHLLPMELYGSQTFTTANKTSGGSGNGTNQKDSILTPSTIQFTGHDISVRVSFNGNELKAISYNDIPLVINKDYTVSGNECIIKSDFFDSLTDHSATLTFHMTGGTDPKLTILIPAIQWHNPFTDVQQTDWFYKSVQYVNEAHIFFGITETVFQPKGNMSRAMMVTVLWRIAGSPENVQSERFHDVSEDAWYLDALNWARKLEIIGGVGDNRFNPDRHITREEMAVILMNFSTKMGIDIHSSQLQECRDMDHVSDWAKDSVEKLFGAGVLSGKGNGIFDPGSSATRAEVATLIMNYMEEQARNTLVLPLCIN